MQEPLLPETHRVAIAFSTRSIAARTGFAGTTSLTSANTKSAPHQNSVLSASSVAAIAPRTTGGRARNMMVTGNRSGAAVPVP